MEMYQHDSVTMFRFVLRGELAGVQVRELEHAWTAERSVLAAKELVVDISGITNADSSGIDLLSRMRESGARLTAALPPASEAILRSLEVPVAAPSGWRHILARRVRQALQVPILGPRRAAE
jgi:ABC-type transporter Mla MlaB component